MVLAQKQIHRSMQQDRIPRNKPTHLWSIKSMTNETTIYNGEKIAEIQKIARRDKKAFLSNQCKEIEENNRMGKIRDLFMKIRDTEGTFHAKMAT